MNQEQIITKVMKGATIALSVTLFWFAFVYYPKTIRNIETGKISISPKIFKPVTATSYVFPIETSAYKIEKSQEDSNYYVVVNGRNLAEYEVNRNNARLALKTALSLETTCSINVVYVSSSKLNVPDSLKSGDCSR